MAEGGTKSGSQLSSADKRQSAPDDVEKYVCLKYLPDIKTYYKSEKHVLSMHVEYWVLGQSGKKGDERKREHVKHFTETFFRKVCSLRNSKGGVLAIHVQNKNDNCGPCLDDFDQKVSKDLSFMIEDDSPFVYNYQRRWFVDQSGEYNKAKYIVVIVKGSSSVSTKSFNTLVPYDGSKERPRARELAIYLSENRRCGYCTENVRTVYKEGEYVDLIESRGVQFKSMSEDDLKKDSLDHRDRGRVEQIVYRLIEKLHLLEYLTTFSKLVSGGSFFLGIEEEKQPAMAVHSPLKQESGERKRGARQKLEFHDDVSSNIREWDSRRTEGRGSERYKKHGHRRSSWDEPVDQRPKGASRVDSRHARRQKSEYDDRNPERYRSRSRTREDHRSSRNTKPASGTAPRQSLSSSSKSPISSPTASKASETVPRHSSRSSVPSSPAYKACERDSKREDRRKHPRSIPPLNIQHQYTSPLPSPSTPLSASPGGPSTKDIKTGHNIVRGFQLKGSDTKKTDRHAKGGNFRENDVAEV
ncbi:uncharacterized protein LOC124261084 isoform X2 [Haliotis rubra]|uniref:uncharacterized protein LOC124261084 isoform X2 n=1 Tax=Haliotis rubra TaxID=36100 RepID=UPI001EE5996B|nr:uncharacterized protein LOC124261084 isoform X2 [Haliotis rubra]